MLNAPRIALLRYVARPAVHALTLPSLERFVAAHPGRYDLIVETDALLDPHDFDALWNRLALVRKYLLMGGYDVVACVDDGLLITEPSQDPLFEVLASSLLMLAEVAHVLVAAAQDPEVLAESSADAPAGSARGGIFSMGVLAVRQDRDALKIVDELFRIARRPQEITGRLLTLRKEGRLDEDALAVYVQRHGRESIKLLAHRTLGSTVRPGGKGSWRPGDFAAHFESDAADPLMTVAAIEGFLLGLSARGAT